MRNKFYIKEDTNTIKKVINKTLVWGSWWFGVIMASILEAIMFIPITIYGLINDVSLRDIFKSFWIDGFYNEFVEQYRSIKELGL